jgi:hypothetical protein
MRGLVRPIIGSEHATHCRVGVCRMGFGSTYNGVRRFAEDEIRKRGEVWFDL